ncbi:MAG TPA: succinate dehydrogenase assembly factor 2, partial [Steroidobacteraceae bacterium]|nr:succinate dehydrogenase assembly factor 2 [Steroidobacteraceae bacterium]
WRCRRGMKELDVLLERFVAERYAHCSPAGRDAFERLLEQSDPELVSWLLGQARPDDLALAEAVRLLRGSRD